MRKLLALSLFCCLAIFGASTCHADSVAAYFNLSCTGYFVCAPGGTAPISVMSAGEVTLSLNGNGTIAVNVYTAPSTLLGFALNSPTNLTISGLTSPAEKTGWSDDFGSQPTGLGCSPACGSDVSFTIDGSYTSVYQVLGGSGSSVDFFLYITNGVNQYGADAPLSPVPEPSSFLLLGTGALGLLGALRRKLAR